MYRPKCITEKERYKQVQGIAKIFQIFFLVDSQLNTEVLIDTLTFSQKVYILVSIQLSL